MHVNKEVNIAVMYRQNHVCCTLSFSVKWKSYMYENWKERENVEYVKKHFKYNQRN